MTAKIYPFPQNRAARLLRDFSRQTDDVSSDLGSMQGSLAEVSSQLEVTKETLANASENMRHTVEDFEHSRRLYQECLDAMDSGSIEEMRKMAARVKKRL